MATTNYNSPLNRFFSSVGSADSNYGGTARSNRFKVMVYRPNVSMPGGAPGEKLVTQNAKDQEAILLRAESATMPGRALQVEENYERYGPSTKMVNGLTYEESNIVFLADQTFDLRLFFEGWQEQSFDTDTWNLRYMQDYAGEVEISLLDNHNVVTYTAKLWEAFPTSIGSQEFNMGSSGELQKITVSFGYRYWTSIPVGLEFAQNLKDGLPTDEYVDEAYHLTEKQRAQLDAERGYGF